MPSIQDLIMNVGGGLDIAQLGLQEAALAQQGELSRQQITQGVLSQLVAMQQNPFNVISALQAQGGPGGVAGAVAAGGGRRTVPFGDIAQRLIENLAAFSGGFVDPATGLPQNLEQLEHTRRIRAGMHPTEDRLLTENEKKWYDTVREFLGGTNLDEDFSVERFRNLTGGGIAPTEARRQSGLSEEDFMAIWEPILKQSAGITPKPAATGTLDPTNLLSDVIGAPPRKDVGVPPIWPRPSLGTLTPNLLRKGMV
jgi:hypothetical protein